MKEQKIHPQASSKNITSKIIKQTGLSEGTLMNNQILLDDIEQLKQRGLFDGDHTVSMLLPTVVDLSLYTTLYPSIQNAMYNNTWFILLDFTNVEKLFDSGIAAFMGLDKLTRDMSMHLFMVNTPTDIYKQLRTITPNAFWIDISCKKTVQQTDLELIDTKGNVPLSIQVLAVSRTAHERVTTKFFPEI